MDTTSSKKETELRLVIGKENNHYFLNELFIKKDNTIEIKTEYRSLKELALDIFYIRNTTSLYTFYNDVNERAVNGEEMSKLEDCVRSLAKECTRRKAPVHKL